MQQLLAYLFLTACCCAGCAAPSNAHALDTGAITPPSSAAPAADSATSENFSVEVGLPCFEEVCVGDQIHDLWHVPWSVARNPIDGRPVSETRLSQPYLHDLAGALRGDAEAVWSIAPYWIFKRIDAEGLRWLGKIVAVCKPFAVTDRLRGEYLSAAGHITEVTFEPVPTADGREQNFTVATLTRTFGSAMNAAELQQLGVDIAERYGAFGMYPNAERAGVRWLPATAQGPVLRLYAPIGDTLKRNNDLLRHPTCMG